MEKMDDDKFLRTYYEWTPPRRRLVGRSRIRWRDTIRAAISVRGSTLENVGEHRYYTDRVEWRRFAKQTD